MTAAVQAPAQAHIPGLPATAARPPAPAPKVALAGALARPVEVRVTPDGQMQLHVQMDQPDDAPPLLAIWCLPRMARETRIDIVADAEAWRPGDGLLVVGRGITVAPGPLLRVRRVLAVQPCDLAAYVGPLDRSSAGLGVQP